MSAAGSPRPVAAPSAATRSSITGGTAVAITLLAFAGVLAARVAAPSDLATRDQERVVAYVVDAVERGHWLWQQDVWGNFASKPPLFNWLAALAVAARGEVTRFAVGLPSALAALTTALLVCWCAGWLRGPRAGALAAMALLASQLGLRQVYLVRSDAVFQCGVFAASVLALRAAERGRGWWGAWLAATAATLAKGPLGVLLAALGLVGLRRDPPRAGWWAPRRGHVVGVASLLLFGAGWFVAADVDSGGRAFAKLFVDELAGHALGTREDLGTPGSRWSRPTLYFVTRAAPLSWLALVAIWRAWRRPSADPRERRWTRAFAWQVTLGLALLSLGAESRFVHLLPLLPAAAVLAGLELDRLWAQRCAAARAPVPPSAAARRTAASLLAAALALGIGAAIYLQFDGADDELQRGEDALRGGRELAASLGVDGLDGVWRARPLAALHAGSFAPVLDDATAVARLGGGTDPVRILVDPAAVPADALDRAAIHVVWRGPFGGHAALEVWSNVPGLPPPQPRPTPWTWWALLGALGVGIVAGARGVARAIDRGGVGARAGSA